MSSDRRDWQAFLERMEIDVVGWSLDVHPPGHARRIQKDVVDWRLGVHLPGHALHLVLVDLAGDDPPDIGRATPQGTAVGTCAVSPGRRGARRGQSWVKQSAWSDVLSWYSAEEV